MITLPLESVAIGAPTMTSHAHENPDAVAPATPVSSTTSCMRETPGRHGTDGVDDTAPSEPNGLDEKEWA